MIIHNDRSQYLIYLVHKNPTMENRLRNLILDTIPNTRVVLFREVSEIPIKDPLVDLVIFDYEYIQKLRKDNVDLEIVYQKYDTSAVPFLIIVTEKEYGKIELNITKTHPEIIYDFFNETVFNENIFINRIKVLLSIPNLTKYYTSEKDIVQKHLWLALDYSNFFIVIVNKDFKVVLANYQLAKTLGYENIDQLIGCNWSKHLTAVDQEVIHHVHETTLKGSTRYEEYSNDIVTNNGKRITVKWFNSMINHTFNCIFSIGVPLTKEITVDDNIDSVRAYFTDILRKDSATIQAMKEVTMKYSEKILSKPKS